MVSLLQMNIVNSCASWRPSVTGHLLLHIEQFRWNLDHRLIYARMLVDMGNTFDVIVPSEELLTVVFPDLVRPRVPILDSMLRLLRDGMQVESDDQFQADEYLSTLPHMIERVLHLARLAPLQDFPDSNSYCLSVEHNTMMWQFAVYKDQQLPLLYFWDQLPHSSALLRISTVYDLQAVMNMGLTQAYFPMILAQALAIGCSSINIQLTVLNMDGELCCRYVHTVNIGGTWKALNRTQHMSLPTLEAQIKKLMNRENIVPSSKRVLN